MRYFLFAILSIFFLTSCATPAPSPTITPKPSSTPTRTSTPTSTPTDTSSPTPTATPILIEIIFIAFHDYDGNGELNTDMGEPLLSDIIVAINDESCKTDLDGICVVDNIPVGKHRYTIDKTNGKYKWILQSVWESFSIDEEISININQDVIEYIPLAEGRYVLPFPKGSDYEIFTWYDRDKDEKNVKNWKGQTDAAPGRYGETYYSFPIRVGDGHCAIDYVFKESVPVIASDAGEIIDIVLDINQDVPNDHIVKIMNDENIILNYGHVNILDDLSVGDEVHRGEIIGYATAHHYPHDWEPVFQGYDYMIHQGYEPKGMMSHCDALDPFYLHLWTTSEYELAKVGVSDQ